MIPSFECGTALRFPNLTAINPLEMAERNAQGNRRVETAGAPSMVIAVTADYEAGERQPVFFTRRSLSLVALPTRSRR